MISSRLIVESSSFDSIIDIKCTKNVFFEVENVYFIAKFYDIFDFWFNERRSMHSKLMRIRFRCDESFHDWMIKIREWIFWWDKILMYSFFCHSREWKRSTWYFITRVTKIFHSKQASHIRSRDYAKDSTLFNKSSNELKNFKLDS